MLYYFFWKTDLIQFSALINYIKQAESWKILRFSSVSYSGFPNAKFHIVIFRTGHKMAQNINKHYTLLYLFVNCLWHPWICTCDFSSYAKFLGLFSACHQFYPGNCTGVRWVVDSDPCLAQYPKMTARIQ